MSSMDANFPPENDDKLQTETRTSSDGQQLEPQATAPTREQNACLEPTLNHDDEIGKPNVENSSRTRKRKSRSTVWKEFITYQGKDGKLWAVCIHCRNRFDALNKNGTTHLDKHLGRCRNKRNGGGGGETLADERGNSTYSAVLKGKFMINQELNQLDPIRAVIKYGFSKLNYLKPDIIHVYEEEKEKLCRYLSTLSCRFNVAIRWVEESFSMDIHYIDDNWELKQKTISFHPTICSDFLDTFKDCLSDWKIDKNICSVVTNADKEEVNEKISSWITKEGALPLGGQLLSTGCLAYFLISHSWTTKQDWAADKIEKCLQYVRESLSNKQNFQIAIDNAKFMGKKVTSRFIPRLCLGLEELEIAIGYKEAFCELEKMDCDFKSINLSEEEWCKAAAIYESLKVLNDAARGLSETKYTTPNVFFPKFCELYMELIRWERSGNYHVRKIASSAKERFFEKYWCNSKLVLAIAVVLDPRFKMDIVERWYKEIYGTLVDAYLEEIVDGLTNVYNLYANSNSKMLDEMGRPCKSSANSELVFYLKEPKIPSIEDFDILGWWQLNSPTYPILASMARDFLAVPISRTAFEDSSLRNEMDNVIYCFGMDADIKQALICTKSWLETPENN
ncbi:Zinc finger BED domain-containing protein [Melia azedarach]|uniref:Zinc finger BED domain-containing protein n=1 Tax=Melia azedarach TaxID=155640 RepID=A0ACC1YJP6_MELAZ|nr:Zinc finger BED domain-containing protein [Melia azedarach]